MATLSLLDAFGLDISGSLKPDSRLGKALSQFRHFETVPLDQVAFVSGKADLHFLEPIAISASGLALVIGTGLSGTLRILAAKDHQLDTGGAFESVPIRENEIYLGAELAFSLQAGVTVGSTACAFGLSVTRGFKVAIEKRFYRSDKGAFPGFGVALAQLFHSFIIPQSQDDLDVLDRDTIIVATGSGQLKLSNSFGIAAPVKQLAATSPIAGQVVQVNTSASFTAELSLTLSGGYVSRMRKLENQAIEIGISQSESSTLAVQVSALAGAVASVGSFDLAEKFISALSRNPVLDLEEFRRSLPSEDDAARDLQIANFQDSLVAAISTKIAVSAVAVLSRTQEKNPVLAFEASADTASDPRTTAALVAAMEGNFTSLTTSPLPPGIRQTSNIFTESEVSKQKITVNLLGIVNFVSVGKLARLSEVKRNADGEITLLTDTADANRLEALLLNVAGGRKRLRSLLSEDFLIQATFKASHLKLLPPEFSAKHTFLEINNKTGGDHMKESLEVCRTMGLLTVAEEAARLQGRQSFGRTTFWLQTSYSMTAIKRIFLDSSGVARTTDDFVVQGRQALGELIAGNEGQEFRKLVADLGPNGNRIWEKMDELKNRANFNAIFGVPLSETDPRVAAAAADYACIMSWASAMHALAQILVEVRSYTAGTIDTDDDHITRLREQLRDRMADVVKRSGDHFGDPLGLVTVFLASGRSAGVRVILKGEAIEALNKTIAPAVGASALEEQLT